MIQTPPMVPADSISEWCKGPARTEQTDRSELLQAAAEAFQIGLQKPPRNSFEEGRIACRKLLNGVVMQRLTENQRILSARCKQYYTKAREAARRGDIGGSCQLFGMAKSIAGSQDLCREAQLLCAADIAAAEAYLEYCCEYYEQAVARLHDALVLDESLESEFGYCVLHAHRLHLVNNLIKTQARFSSPPAAMQLASSALAYLLGRTETMAVPGTWGQDKLSLLPKEVIAMMFAQAIGEIATLLAGIERTEAAELLDLATGQIDTSSDESVGEKQASEWLRIKRLFCSGDVNSFLTRASWFLAEGPGDTASLWQTIALDLSCECAADPASRPFAEMILQSAASWKMASQTVQKTISHLARSTSLRASSRP